MQILQSRLPASVADLHDAPLAALPVSFKFLNYPALVETIPAFSLLNLIWLEGAHRFLHACFLIQANTTIAIELIYSLWIHREHMGITPSTAAIMSLLSH